VEVIWNEGSLLWDGALPLDKFPQDERVRSEHDRGLALIQTSPFLLTPKRGPGRVIGVRHY
jgi:hypothetical protein